MSKILTENIEINKDLINSIIKETINGERKWVFEDRRLISIKENDTVLLRFEEKDERRFLDLVLFDVNRGELGTGGKVITETNEDLWEACNVLKYLILESISKKDDVTNNPKPVKGFKMATVDKEFLNLVIMETITGQMNWGEDKDENIFITDNKDFNVVLRFEEKNSGRILDLVTITTNSEKFGYGLKTILENNKELWEVCNVLKYHVLEYINNKGI